MGKFKSWRKTPKFQRSFGADDKSAGSKNANKLDKNLKMQNNKMLAKVIFQFFLIVWGIGIMPGLTPSVRRYGVHIQMQELLKTAGISAAAAVIISLITFIGVTAYAKKGKDRDSRFAQILRKYGRASREAYDFCTECFNLYSARPNQKSAAAYWAVQAAAVCYEGGDTAEARRCLGLADMSEYFDSPEDTYNLLHIINFFQLLIALDIAEKNTEAADRDFAAAKPYFGEIKEGNGYYPHVETTVCQYLAFKGETEEALRRLHKQCEDLTDSVHREIRSEIYAQIGEIYLKTGRMAEAEDFFGKSLDDYPEEYRWDQARRIETIKFECQRKCP